MRIAALLAFLLVASSAQAITLPQAKSEATAWVTARGDVILDRIIACIAEGNPRVCHTAWVSSNTPNTTAAAGSLATVTFDDPGRLDQCGLPTGRGSYVNAGIAIPASGPVNVKINIAKSKVGWGAQVVIEIRHAGTLYRRGFGRGIFAGFAWQKVVEL